MACEPRAPQPLPEPQCANDVIACTRDDDCPSPLSRSFCDAAGCCVIGDGGCLIDRDCANGQICDQRRGLCEQVSSCEDTVDSRDCLAGELCLFDLNRFRCTDGALGGAESCAVRAAVAVSGQRVVVEALALDGAGAPVAHPDVDWSASVGAFAGNTFTASCEDAFCDVEVTAMTIRSGASCLGTVRVYPALAASAATRVIVVDENNVPLDARVDALVDGALVSVDTTNASATFGGDVALVTVFADGRESNTYLAPSGDVIVVARKHDPARARGVKGAVNFDQISTQGDIRLALTGLTIPSLIDATREEVLGTDVRSNIELEGITAPGGEVVTLPSIVTLSLGDNPIKGDYVAIGTQAPLWSLGVQIPLAEIGGPLSEGVNFASLASAVLPALARADHAHHDVSTAESARPDDPADFAAWSLPEHVAQPHVVTLSERTLNIAGVEHDLVTAALVRVPTRGFVPLGVGDERLSFAPPHNGLEGNPVVVVAIDVDLATFDSVRASIAPLDEALPPLLPHLEATFDGVTFTSTNDPGAPLYRVRFDGWNVWSKAPPTFSVDEIGVTGEARAEVLHEEEGAFAAISSRVVGVAN